MHQYGFMDFICPYKAMYACMYVNVNVCTEQALMSEYEKELQTPIKGIMFGSLMTAILIQVNTYVLYIA